MKLKYSILFAGAALALLPSAVMAMDKKAVYGKENVFDVVGGCIGAGPGTVLSLKEKFRMFLRDDGPFDSKTPPDTGEVSRAISAKEAAEKFKSFASATKSSFDRVYHDKPLWEEIGCVHILRSEDAVGGTLARITPATDDSYGLAIRNLPAQTWVLQGLGKPVSMSVKGNPYVETVKHLVTGACYGPDSRVEVSETSVLNGRSIVQLVIGKVKKNAQNGAYLDSAENCRFFLDGKRVLMTETFSHVAGPNPSWGEITLEDKDWPFLRESNLGFISLDAGKTWEAIQMLYGMETVNYIIMGIDKEGTRYHHGSTPAFR